MCMVGRGKRGGGGGGEGSNMERETRVGGNLEAKEGNCQSKAQVRRVKGEGGGGGGYEEARPVRVNIQGG